MRGFLSSVLLTHQILELLERQVSPSQLIFADPCDGFVPVRKRLLIGGELEFRVLLKDTVAVVSIHDDAVPDDQRIDNHTISQDVFLQLLLLLFPKGRDYARKLRVNG